MPDRQNLPEHESEAAQRYRDQIVEKKHGFALRRQMPATMA